MGVIVGKCDVKLSLMVPSSFNETLSSADLEGTEGVSDEDEAEEEEEELVSASMGVSLPADAVSSSIESVALPPKRPFSLPAMNYIFGNGTKCKKIKTDPL